jgi:hypothetical protein
LLAVFFLILCQKKYESIYELYNDEQAHAFFRKLAKTSTQNNFGLMMEMLKLLFLLYKPLSKSRLEKLKIKNFKVVERDEYGGRAATLLMNFSF